MKRPFLYFFLFCCCLQGNADPYTEVDLLPFDPLGAYSNGPQMSELLQNTKAQVVIEVGCWLGQSTRHIASLLPADGKVYAVDHWLGSEEHQQGQGEYWPSIHFLYQQFLSNVIHAGLTDKIVPLRMSSLEAARYLSVVPDLIYIDASHTQEDVLDDLNAWYPFVQGHGTLCGDDWSWPGVAEAVRLFAEKKNLRIHASDNFWRLEE